MSLFSGMTAEAQREREEFFKEFETKTGEKVKSLELAELRADAVVYQELNLKTYRPGVWGLIVFCEKTAYYYVAPQESYLSFFMKGAGRAEERLFSLTELSAISFSLPKRGLLSFLNPETARSVNASYKNFDGAERSFTLVLNHKADDVFAMLNAIIVKPPLQ